MRTTIIRLFLPVALLVLAAPSFAQSAWVSDQFEITLRSGPSTSNEIRLMLSSGTRLEILERDADTGYARVRTPGGTEGWVLTRYLMSEPSAREQLETLSSQLSNATSRGSSLDEQLSTVRSEYQQAQERIQALENENSELESELEEITSTAANVLAINEENKELRQQLMDSGIQVDALEQENRELSGQTNRYWFLSGGAVLVVGIILGLWLPRIRWQRRSRYDRF
jgi:SH3 domain protein